MKRIALSLAMMFISTSLFIEAKPVPKAPEKPPAKIDDVAALQGEWEVVSQQPFKGLKLIVKGNSWTPPSSKMKLTFQLDATKSPKQLDLVSEEGGISRGIYKIDGETFTFCRSMGPDGGRPTEFDATAAFLMVCKRVTTQPK